MEAPGRLWRMRGKEKESSRSTGVVLKSRRLCITHYKESIEEYLGYPQQEKTEIEGLVKSLESWNPNPEPTGDLEKVSGCWKLIYSTISILGTKRTKLGLRDFVSLEDILQTIDVDEGKALNIINFQVKGLRMLKGQLTIVTNFEVTSPTRVKIECQDSTVSPDQLLNLFKKNYDLLLAIFNPEGWLDITYVDEDMRIGRDDKGNLFVLQRA